MKLEFARRDDADWSPIQDVGWDGNVQEDMIWAARLTGTTAEGRKFILNLTQDPDGVVKITEIKGKVRIDALAGRVEVIGNEF